MTVYVDDMYAPFGRRMIMCHMCADTTEELMAMAKTIGLRPEWIQHKGTWREHFDVAKGKRALAVQAGAVEVTQKDLVRRMKAAYEARQDRERLAATMRVERDDARALRGWKDAPEWQEEDPELIERE